MKMNRPTLLSLLLLGGLNASFAQRDSTSLLKRYDIKVSVALQLWTTYTFGMKVYNADEGRYEAVGNRLNTQLRRGRLGISGRPYEDVYFNFTGAYDLVGRDLLSATEGGANNGAWPQFRLLNAYVQWRLLPRREALYLVAGYFSAPIGRESLTSVHRSSSMEKAWSQNYLRRHLTGIGTGRATGLRLGGLVAGKNGRKIQLNYDLSLQNPVFMARNGNSTGHRFSPLLTGRMVLQLGDPEAEKYTLSHQLNYWSKRHGLSLGLAGATMGATDLFAANHALGADFLLNCGPVNFDGDFTYLYRTAFHGGVSQTHTGYLRLSYNVTMPRQRLLEPVLTYWAMHGPLEADEQELAGEVGAFAGRDESLDAGFNYYFNPAWKLALHYTWRCGNAGEGQPTTIRNNYFQQPDLGPILRGDWIGLGMVLLM